MHWLTIVGFEHRFGAGGLRSVYWGGMGSTKLHHQGRPLCTPMEHAIEQHARPDLCQYYLDLPSPKLPASLLILSKLMYIFSTCYTISIGFAKAAILLEWTRIFVPRGVRNKFFWAAYILLAVNSLLYFSASVAVICSCIPPRKLWYPFIAGQCLDRQDLDTTAAAVNIVTDIAVFILPQRKIWSLQMTKSRKIGLSVIFSFGILYVNDLSFPSPPNGKRCLSCPRDAKSISYRSCASAIGRLEATITTVYVSNGDTGDVSYTASPTFLWCLAEMTCVFLVFCIPMIPGAFSSKTLFGRALNLVRSWTLIVTSKISSRKGSGSTSQESWAKSVEHRGHRLADYDEQAVNISASEYDEYEQHPVSIVDLETSRTTKSHGTGITGPYRDQAIPSDRAILMTTEFELHDDIVPKTSTSPQHMGTSVRIHG